VLVVNENIKDDGFSLLQKENFELLVCHEIHPSLKLCAIAIALPFA